MDIKIDFHGSTHGHFLEYISNVYIMQTNPVTGELFNSNGAAHAVDIVYLKHRVIRCGHFSSNNIKFKNTDTVIRITIDSTNDRQFYMALTNAIYRAGDVGFERQILRIPEDIRKNPVEHRNNWFSKIDNRDTYANFYNKFDPVTNPTFEFPFESFYSFSEFCKSLNGLATFLNQSFFPDQSLFETWKKFIEMNQGIHSYNKCNTILENIFANNDANVDCTIIEQAWINYNLTKMCRIYNGPMFEYEQYPTNAKDIYQVIEQHLKHFQNS